MELIVTFGETDSEFKADFGEYATISVDMTDYVKKTDYATGTTPGLVKANSNQGFFIGVNGDLSIVQAQDNDFINKTNKFRPITANNLDKAVKVGLTTNTQTLPKEEQAAVCEWLGVVDAVLAALSNGDEVAY